MPLTLRDNLPFTTITVTYQGTTMDIPQVLVDTEDGKINGIFAPRPPAARAQRRGLPQHAAAARRSSAQQGAAWSGHAAQEG